MPSQIILSFYSAQYSLLHRQNAVPIGVKQLDSKLDVIMYLQEDKFKDITSVIEKIVNAKRTDSQCKEKRQSMQREKIVNAKRKDSQYKEKRQSM